MSRAPSRAGSGRRMASNRSSLDTLGGLRLKVDPTLPSTHRAVVGMDGKRQAVVKPIGRKYFGSWDNYGTQYSSAQAAVRGFESFSPDSSSAE